MKKVADRQQRSGSPIRECMPDISISPEEAQSLYKSLTTGNLDKASKLWKKYGYIFLEPLQPIQNFELIRSITKSRDNAIARLEAELRLLSKSRHHSEMLKNLQEKEYEIEILRNTLAQKNTQNPEQDQVFVSSGSGYELEIQEKHNEIKELLKEYENLQLRFDSLEREKEEIERENNRLKGMLTRKSDDSKYKSDGFIRQSQQSQNSTADEGQEMAYLKQLCNEYAYKNSFLEAELKIFKDKKEGDIYDLRDQLLHILLKAQLGEDEIAKINKSVSEIIHSRIAEQLEFIQPSINESLKIHNETIQNEKFIKDIECIRLNLEIKRLSALMSNEKIAEQEMKKVPKDSSGVDQWKKIRRESIERVEKTYQEQCKELNRCIKELSERNSGQIKEIAELKDQLNAGIREVTIKLKREHETKKQIADHFAKEKLSHEKTKEQLRKLIESNNVIMLKLGEESKKLTAEKDQKINELEYQIEKHAETIKNLESKLHENEFSKQKMYFQITKLNKKSQDSESETVVELQELQREIEHLSDQKDSQARMLQDKEEAIEELTEANQRLEKEILDLDYKIQTQDNFIEKLKKNSGSEDFERENFELKGEIESLQDQIEVYEESTNQLKQEIARLRDQLLEVENDLANSKKFGESSNGLDEDQRLKDYSARVDELENRYSALSKDFEYSKREIMSINEEKSNLQIFNTQIVREKETMLNQIKDLEQKLENALKRKSILERSDSKDRLSTPINTKEEDAQTDSENGDFVDELRGKIKTDGKLKELLESIKAKFTKWNQEYSMRHKISFSTIGDINIFIDILIEEYKKLQSNEKFNITVQHMDAEGSRPMSIANFDTRSYKQSLSPRSYTANFDRDSVTSYDEAERFRRGPKSKTFREEPDNRSMKERQAKQKDTLDPDQWQYKTFAPNPIKDDADTKSDFQYKRSRTSANFSDKPKERQESPLPIKKDYAIGQVQTIEPFIDEKPFKESIKKLEEENSSLKELVKNLQKLEEENSSLKELIKNLKKLEDENISLRESEKKITQDCDDWKSSLLEIYSNIIIDPNEKREDIAPIEITKRVVEILNSKEEIIKDETPQEWANKENAYMQSIESLTVEKKCLLKSVEDYEKEVQTLRKQTDFYKIAANSQMGDTRKRDSIYVEDPLDPRFKEQHTIEELEAQSKYMQELIKEYKENKDRIQEKLHSHCKYIDNVSRSTHQELLQALYEERKLREELEYELSHKCDLIEELLAELENKRRFIQTREYEFQEIISTKDKEILRLRCRSRLSFSSNDK